MALLCLFKIISIEQKQVHKFHPKVIFFIFLLPLKNNCNLLSVLGFAGVFHELPQPAAVKGKYNIHK